MSLNISAVGDSLSHQNYPPPNKELRYLRTWAIDRLGRKKVTVGGDDLEHGLQNDTWNCGIIAANTIAHAAFGDALWTKESGNKERLKHFCGAIDLLVDGGLSNAQPRREWGILNEEDTTLQTVESSPNSPDLPTPASTPREMTSSDERLDVDSKIGESCGATRDTATPGLEAEQELACESSACMNVDADVVDDAICNDGVDKGLREGDEGKDEGDEGKGKKKRSRSASHDGAGPASPSLPKVARTDSNTNKPMGSKPKTRKTAEYENALRDACKSGMVLPTDPRVVKWRAKIRELDPGTYFDDDDLHAYWHTKCGQMKHVKQLGDMTRWREHNKKCKGKENSKSILSYFGTGLSAKLGSTLKRALGPASTSKLPARQVPCPGLGKALEPLVPQYLKRTGAAGGGGTDVQRIAKETFKRAWKALTSGMKDEAYDRQVLTHTWRNDHQNLRVYATKCEKFVSEGAAQANLSPCYQCNEVLRSKKFRTAIGKPVPEAGNRKYINTKWANEILGKHYLSTKGLQGLIEDVGFCFANYQRLLAPGC